MLFWIVTAALTAIIAASLSLAAWRARDIAAIQSDAVQNGVVASSSARSDLEVYRAQLAEVDRDLARGILPQAEAERTRIEIKRRILEADRTARAATPTVNAPRAALYLGGILGAGLLLGCYVLYLQLGAAGYADQPLTDRLAKAQALYASRPDQTTAEAQAAKTREKPQTDPRLEALVAELRSAMERRPDAIEGLQLLSQNEEILGNYRAAWEAQQKLIAAKGAEATAEDYVGLADMMIISAGGFVSPEAEKALLKALELDPANAPARFYAGLMMAQNGRPDQTFDLWARLLEEGPEDAPWIAQIHRGINELAWLAGVPNYTAPPVASSTETLSGPDAAAIAAASELNDTERTEMVQGMVAQLAERLQTEGGSPQEWARLISSLGILGDTETQAAAIRSAKSAHPGQADLFDQAAKGAVQ